MAGIHIRSRLIVPDDHNLAQMITITPQTILWTSEVFVNQKIFAKMI